ncbi:Hint domain-containing protein [Pseudoruegeria sp. HB172150]|uniref:Hint domain-containing protein n=1 Tax=Pseudoruegeria sp. HB172150 TaxID=2721164 RepID=UPI001556A53A|nr:Hint domain-containing protein [Pseudoruegeria sp. HB172150]
MTWLAISDGRHCLRAPQGKDLDDLITRGSVMIEVQLYGDRPQKLNMIEMERTNGWFRRFSVTLAKNAHISVEHRQADTITQAILKKPRTTSHDTLRLTYSWDAPARRGVLTAENTTSGTAVHAFFEEPQPLLGEDIHDLVNGQAFIDPAVSLFAVSDRIEPSGPMPGFLEGSWIGTPDGPRRIEDLAEGDEVLTARNGAQPIRHLVSHEMPATGSFRPVRLRAPFLGLRTDLCVAPHHRIRVNGTDTEYLFGNENALVEARHLGPMIGPAHAGSGATARYYQMVLDHHDCVNVAGGWAESLYLGDLARQPARQTCSLFAGIPAGRLPVHEEIAGTVLEPYEASVLVANLCA